MSGILTAAVAVLGTLALANLLLTFGVIRRLREHGDRLAQSSPPGSIALPPSGTTIADFRATTVDGVSVARESYSSGVAYVGFFSAACQPCREQLPRFLAAVRGADRTQVLIVAIDDPQGEVTRDFMADAVSVGQVLVEAAQGPVAAAFTVTAQPTMVVLVDGVVVASGHRTDELPLLVRA